MSFNIARNIDQIRELAEDPLFDRERDEEDDYADSLDDEAFERDAMSVWDAVNKQWVDIAPLRADDALLSRYLGSDEDDIA